MQLLFGIAILAKNKSAIAAIMKAYHTHIIDNTGRWEYSFHGYEMLYSSVISEKLSKELYSLNQRVCVCIYIHTHMHIALYVYLYVHIYLKPRT